MDFKRLVKENVYSLLLFVLMVNYGFVHFCVIWVPENPSGEHAAAAALRDYGLISVLTIFCILSAELMALWLFAQKGKWHEKLGFLGLAYSLQIYLLREADFHRLFSEKSLTSMKFYRGDYPIVTKLIAGPILLVFIGVFIYILLRYGWPVIKDFFRGKDYAVAICIWGLLFLGSQAWDQSRFADEETYGLKIKLIEEYMEFMASTYLPLIMIMYIRSRKKRLTEKKETQE